MGRPWIKLWHDLLHDSKMAMMPEHLQLRFIKLLLIAGDIDESGLLPSVERIAYDLGLDGDRVPKARQTLAALREVGVVEETPQGWVIVNWEQRQARSESAERVRKYREKRQELGMPSSYTYSHHEILKRDGFRCVYCGSTDSLCVDHLIPIKKGGTDDHDNLACACKGCNSAKSGRTPEEAGFQFLNKEAKRRYELHVMVTGNKDSDSSSASESNSDSSLLKPGKESKYLGGEDFRFYEQEIGILTPMIADSIQEAEKEYPVGWIQMAIAEAAAHNKRSWKYVEAILKRWKVEGPQSRKARDNGAKPDRGSSSLPSAFEAWENLCGAWVGEKSEAEVVDEKIFINKILYTWLHPEVERIGRMLGWPKEFPNPKNMSTDRAHFVKAWEQGARDG